MVTGMGAVTPIGLTVKDYWQSLQEGRLGIEKISSFDTQDFPVSLAAEINDYDPKDSLDRKSIKRMDRISMLAMTAAQEAFLMAGLEGAFDPRRAGVLVGNGIGGLLTITQGQDKLVKRGASRISPFFVPNAIGNMPGGNIAIGLGLEGPNMTLVTACASATNALGEAFHKIKFGLADLMLAGGTEASICPLGVGGFAAMGALSDSDDPSRASIPFDKDRSGFVMGEGAGILVLESLEHAQKRGARILAEMTGYGASCDAYHITAPEESGAGAVRAMEAALAEGHTAKEDIGYINAHGTSTPFNDAIESQAIRQVFGDHTDKLLVQSTKSMTGHLLGAAGAVEAISCVKSLQTSIIPPTIGTQKIDPVCPVPVVVGQVAHKDLTALMTNSLGFGGHNAVLVMRRYD